MALSEMKIRLPDHIMSDQGVTVVLPDGRSVSLSPSGRIYVYSREHQLGGEDYSLELPTVGFVQENCDAQDDAYGSGQVMIPVEHRH